MSVDITVFWSELSVGSGNKNANNWYDVWNGIVMTDGYVCKNIGDVLNWNNIVSQGTLNYNRYTFFKDYNNVDVNIVDEFTFYQNTSDINIYDFKTFYENAAQYFPEQN